MLKPQVAAFLDTVSSHGRPRPPLEEIEVDATCPQAGRTIRELRIRHETGAVSIALRKSGRQLRHDARARTRAIEAGDVLIASAPPDELQALEDLFAPRETVAG